MTRLHATDGRFPAWPIETSLPDEPACEPGRYAGADAALVLTHDVDSADELELIAFVRRLERRHGVVSAFGFVPLRSWPTERTVRELIGEGCEAYWHDIAHDGRLPYAGRSRIREAFAEVDARSPWALAAMRAFRAGQLLASRDLLDVVAERFDVDLSIPDTELGGPHGGAAGCGSVVPFQLRGVLEIPLTMPQDVFVRHVHRLAPREILRVWRAKLAYIRSRGGVAVLNTHPVWLRRDPELVQVVSTLLDDVMADGRWLITTPTQLHRLLLGAPPAPTA